MESDKARAMWEMCKMRQQCVIIRYYRIYYVRIYMYDVWWCMQDMMLFNECLTHFFSSIISLGLCHSEVYFNKIYIIYVNVCSCFCSIFLVVIVVIVYAGVTNFLVSGKRYLEGLHVTFIQTVCAVRMWAYLISSYYHSLVHAEDQRQKVALLSKTHLYAKNLLIHSSMRQNSEFLIFRGTKHGLRSIQLT